MLRGTLVLAGTLGVVGLIPWEAEWAPPTIQGTPVQVQVDVRCVGSQVDFSVDPWRAVLDQGQEIEWVLNEGATTNAVEIEPKTGRWPFVGPPPYAGTKQAPARPGQMRPNQGGGPAFQYNIRLVCEQEGEEPITVLIDPDIIVRG
jgi:hypothetical protein